MITYILSGRRNAIYTSCSIGSRTEVSMQQLAEFPETGHWRRDATGRELRFWTVRRWHIVYDPTTCPIEIMRVRAAAQTTEDSI